jgi:hypothetical protein
MRALAQFGFGNEGMHPQDFHSPGNAILLGVKPNRVDLLTGISGVTFEEAWAARTKGELEGIPTQLIGREELLRNKQSTGRAKDMGDAEELRKRPIP